jgi:hypothetical protein
MPATATGRGAQVILTGDAQDAARGAAATTMRGNADAIRQLALAGDVATGYGPDGTTLTGAPATDYATQADIAALQASVDTLAARQQVAATVAAGNPPGTTASVYVMMGISVTFATLSNTRAQVLVSGQIANSANGGTSTAGLRYGTGTPPNNGDPDTGTVIGEPVVYVATSGGGSYAPFSQNAIITGLVPGQTYWIGVALQSSGATIASLLNVQVSAISLIDPVVF